MLSSAKSRLVIAFLILTLQSCLFENPFCTNNDLIDLPILPGQWHEPVRGVLGSAVKLSADSNGVLKNLATDSVTFRQQKDKTYRYYDSDNNGVDSGIVRVFKLGSQIYFDIEAFPPDEETSIDSSRFHMIYKYFQLNDSIIKIQALNYDVFEKKIKSGEIKIAHTVTPSGFIIVTATTRTLQVFLRSITDSAEYWTESETLIKRMN